MTTEISNHGNNDNPKICSEITLSTWTMHISLNLIYFVNKQRSLDLSIHIFNLLVDETHTKK